ncbi:MAG: hypothetical protein PWQ08_466 [Clostridiales bacterium]|nr:hypothetical protein [Clostridiales bacterium]
MEIRQMIYLVEICNGPSLSAAAERLYLTPQALSKAIRALEEELKAPLFFREKGRLLLTPFGRRVLREVKPFVDDYNNLCEQLSRLSTQERGRLSVVFAHGVPNALVGNPVEELAQRYPEVTFDLMELPDLLAEQNLLNEESDIGFLVGPPQPQQEFWYQTLKRCRLCAVVNKDHPLASHKSLCIDDLAGQPIITKNTLFRAYHMVDDLAKQRGIALQYALRSPDEILWISMLEKNKGVGIGVSFLSQELRQTDQLLVHIPFEEPQLVWEICVATKKGHYLSAAGKAVLDYAMTLAE